MVVYKLESNAIFLRCRDKAKLDLYELDDAAVSSSSSIIKGTDWKHVAIVDTNLHCNALEIFDIEINGLQLNNLAEELYNLHVIVNREGFCYLNVSSIVDPSLGLVYYRLNDLFGWSNYGVNPKILSIWNRSDLVKGGAIVNLEDQYNSLKRLQEDLKKKDQELELCKEDISALQIELEKCHQRGSRKPLPPPPPPPPPIRFYISQSPLPTQFDITWILRKFTALDEDVTGLFPRKVSVHVNDGQFDTGNWRFVRGEENNRTYMVAFYGGGFGQVEFHGDVVNIPYNRGVALLADVYFFVALISGFGFRFAFLY